MNLYNGHATTKGDFKKSGLTSVMNSMLKNQNGQHYMITGKKAFGWTLWIYINEKKIQFIISLLMEKRVIYQSYEIRRQKFNCCLVENIRKSKN